MEEEEEEEVAAAVQECPLCLLWVGDTELLLANRQTGRDGGQVSRERAELGLPETSKKRRNSSKQFKNNQELYLNAQVFKP